MIVKPTTIIVVSLVVLLSTIITVQLEAYQQQQQQPIQQQPTVVNTSSPYWKRPGCYRVGHIRTISIPGCVKFNLSTNACRGYCMSYSVPNTMDLGPSSTNTEVEPVMNDNGNLASYVSPTSLTGLRVSKSSERSLNTNESRPSSDAVLIVPESSASLTQSKLDQGEQQQFSNALESMGMSLMQGVGGGGGSRNLPIVLGQSGVQGINNKLGADKRDVVSVSQCCNMMETEEVVVNLRCGANEIRRLVFKSAKSCECFFCKHV